MMSEQTTLEELLTAVASLTEYNSALQEQLTAQSQANTQQAEETATLIRQLTEQLKQYQNKEQYIITKTNQSIANNIEAAFQKNERQYQVLINQAFTTHIDKSTQDLTAVSHRVNQQLISLDASAQKTQKEFESRNNSILAYEDTYKAESKKLQANVTQTLAKVSKAAEERLTNLVTDFTAGLILKVTVVLGSVCLCLLLVTYATSWFFTPSQADIAERRSQYSYLEKGELLEKITKVDGKYYAEVDYDACKEDVDTGKKWCKFK